MYHSQDGYGAWSQGRQGAPPTLEESWTERDIIISLLSNHTAPTTRTHTPETWQNHSGIRTSALSDFITPLSEATLNGRSMQDVCATPVQELSARMKLIEDELYEGFDSYSSALPRQQYTPASHSDFSYLSQPYVLSQDTSPTQQTPPLRTWSQQPSAPLYQHPLVSDVRYGSTHPTPTGPIQQYQPAMSRKRPFPDEEAALIHDKATTNINHNFSIQYTNSNTYVANESKGNPYANDNGNHDHNHNHFNNGKNGFVQKKKLKSEDPQPHFREAERSDADTIVVGESSRDSMEEPTDLKDDSKDSDKALRSRESSRRYRQRKKECFEKMKKQLEAFEAEKRQWLKERDASLQAIEKLKSENELLKNSHNADALKFREERLALLAELDGKVKRGASDEELIPTLTEIKVRCQGIKQVSQSLLRQYISPDAATYLAGIGFFKDVDAIDVDRPSKVQSLYSFAAKLETDVPDLSEEQRQKVQSIVEQFYADLRKLLEERRILAQELQSLYNAEPLIPESSPGGATEQPNTQMILERLSSLQQLRENLVTESDMSLTAISQMLDVLTPMQAARFLVKAHFVHTGVMQLQMIWEALKAQNLNCCN